MARRFRSVKRVARGIFGPSKKTVQRVRKGLRRQASASVRKRWPAGMHILISPGMTLRDLRDLFGSIEKGKRETDELLTGIDKKSTRAAVRIKVKYSLDAMNIAGEKRKIILRIMDEALENKMIRGNKGVAPALAQSIIGRLTKELGSKAMMHIFTLLMKVKARKLNKPL